MSRSWKLVPVAAVVAALSLYLIPNGPAEPQAALAEDCTVDNTGILIIRIYDVSTGDQLNVAGAEVLVKPSPDDFELDDIVVDTDLQDANTSQDKDSNVGIIRIEGACSTEGSENYTASIWSLPGDLDECDYDSAIDSTGLPPEGVESLRLDVDCTGVGATPTPVATATPGPAATVQTSASPLSVGCSGTSVINVQVKDASGAPVKTGTAVTIATTLGSISPSSGFVTGSNGNVYTFFSAPADTGGTATVTANAGSASGTASVAVNCGGVTGTVAPPPTVGAGSGGSVIRPPNTGDGGLTEQDRRPSSAVMVGVAILLGVFGTGLAPRVKHS